MPRMRTSRSVLVFINTATYAPSAAAPCSEDGRSRYDAMPGRIVEEERQSRRGPDRGPRESAGLRSGSRPAGARRAGGPAQSAVQAQTCRPASRRGRIYEYGYLGMRGLLRGGEVSGAGADLVLGRVGTVERDLHAPPRAVLD